MAGKKQHIQDSQLPPRSGPLHALFRTNSTTLDGSGSLWLGKWHLSFSKEMHPCIN